MVALPLAALLLIEACGAGWHQPATGLEPAPLPEGQQVQVWRHGKMDRWHGVVMTTDSVSGIPYQKPLDCSTCRTALGRNDVDSIRVGNPEAAFWKSIGLGVGIFAVLGILLKDAGGK